MLSGAYLGNDPANVAAFEDWLGADVDYVRAFSGRASWSDWTQSVGWVGETLSQAGRPLLWTLPMFANQGSLEAAAAGDYDLKYVDMAQDVLRTSAGQDEIIVRFGEEFNGDWMPWAAAGREDAFVEAFHNMVNAFRSVSDTFKFEWNVNLGGSIMNPEDAYPGDDYVDIVSMDFYYNTAWDAKNQKAAWNYTVSRPYGLKWLEDFADAHGKPTAYSEWGVNSNAPKFIEKAFKWFAEHDAVYQSYWYSNADFAGLLDDSRPEAAAEFREQMLKAIAAHLEPIVTDAAPATSAAPVSWHIGTAQGNDVLVGDDRANSLNGGGGTDRAAGGRGDDTYMVDRTDDVVIESVGEGIDTVLSYAPRTILAANVENLTFLDGWGSEGIGNDLANRIVGNERADTIDGGAGNDWLIGGDGADIFVFKAHSGIDVVTDFQRGGTHDIVRIVDAGVTRFAELQRLMLQVGADTQIILPSSGAIVLKGVAKSELDASMFEFATTPTRALQRHEPPPPLSNPPSRLVGNAIADPTTGDAAASAGADDGAGVRGDNWLTRPARPGPSAVANGHERDVIADFAANGEGDTFASIAAASHGTDGDADRQFCDGSSTTSMSLVPAQLCAETFMFD